MDPSEDSVPGRRRGVPPSRASSRLHRLGAVLAVVLVLAASLTSQLAKAPPAAAAAVPFNVAFHTQDNGSIGIFGNSLQTCPTAASGCTNAQMGIGSGDALDNNSYNMAFVNVDPGGVRTSSSSADVMTAPSTPAGSTVLWAGLFWGARQTAGTGGVNSVGPIGQMLLRTPASSTYQTITALPADVTTSTNDPDNAGAYQGFADITSIVKAAGPGTYFGANVAAATGADRYSGWSIVVAYQNPGLPLRDLTVFKGFDTIFSGHNDTLSISGFVVPPFGTVNTTVGVVAWEGDLGLTGDSMQLNTTTLSDAVNPATNFFNSGDSALGVPVTARNPSFKNMMAVDMKLVGANGILPNGATSATVNLTTNSDVYFPGAVTTAIDLYAPAWPAVTKSVTDLTNPTGPAHVGDTLQYTQAYQNVGGDAATQVIARDSIPAGTTYVPGSINVLTGPNAGPKTDAAGDDQADFDSVNNRVVVRLGTGANATSGGTLNPNPATPNSSSVSFKVTVATAGAGTTINNQAFLDYVAMTIGKLFTYAGNVVSTPVTALADLSLSKTAAPNPVTAGGALVYTLVYTNNGPSTAAAATLTDTLPAGTTFVSATTPTGVTCTGTATVTCQLGDRPSGSVDTIRIQVTVGVGLRRNHPHELGHSGVFYR